MITRASQRARRFLPLVLFLALPVAALQEAHAQFSATANFVSDEGPFAASASDRFTLGGTGPLSANGEARAHAQAGNAGAAAQINVSFVGGGGCLTCAFGQSASASFVLDDIVITGDGGATVMTSINLVASGSVHTDAEGGGALYSRGDARAAASFNGGIHDASGDFGIGFSGTISGRQRRGNDPLFPDITEAVTTGVFGENVSNSSSGVSLSSYGFTTDISELPLNTPLIMEMFLSVSVTGEVNTFFAESHIASGRSTGAFLDTIKFAASGPVFNLPPGFTVNSVDGMIVNNQFVELPIPEPETYAMLMAGLALLGFVARRRRALQAFYP
jgi:PEP-CTERM motif-containing protein